MKVFAFINGGDVKKLLFHSLFLLSVFGLFPRLVFTVIVSLGLKSFCSGLQLSPSATGGEGDLVEAYGHLFHFGFLSCCYIRI